MLPEVLLQQFHRVECRRPEAFLAVCLEEALEQVAELSFHSEFDDVAVAVEDMERECGEDAVAESLALVLVVCHGRLWMPNPPLVKADFGLGVWASVLAGDHSVKVNVILIAVEEVQEGVVCVVVEINGVSAELSALLCAADIVVD